MFQSMQKSIRLENDVKDDTKCRLISSLSGGEQNGFGMNHVQEERFENGSTILFTIPSFSIFIIGDLIFYADVLGMPNSCSYWCPFCLLSRPQWQIPPSNQPAEERTAQFQNERHHAILKDVKKELKPTDKKGVSCEMHCKSLTPQNFVPPLLHKEMGMVNQAWDYFEQWIDDVVEMIPPEEQMARKNVSEAKEYFDVAYVESDEAEKNNKKIE